jgi:hypothetical protein
MHERGRQEGHQTHAQHTNTHIHTPTASLPSTHSLSFSHPSQAADRIYMWLGRNCPPACGAAARYHAKLLLKYEHLTLFQECRGPRGDVAILEVGSHCVREGEGEWKIHIASLRTTPSPHASFTNTHPVSLCPSHTHTHTHI